MGSCSWSTKAIQRIYTSFLRSSTPMSSSTQKTCGFSYWAMGFYPDSCVRPTLSRFGDFFGLWLKLLTGGTATTRLRWTVDTHHHKVWRLTIASSFRARLKRRSNASFEEFPNALVSTHNLYIHLAVSTITHVEHRSASAVRASSQLLSLLIPYAPHHEYICEIPSITANRGLYHLHRLSTKTLVSFLVFALKQATSRSLHFIYLSVLSIRSLLGTGV
jgi:hypothetical protein